MADIRSVTPLFSVAPQLMPAEVAQAASQGFKLLINNRPDGEAPGQPTASQMGDAAEAAGLSYVHIPVRGGPTPEQVSQMQQAVHAAGGPVLAFCRSGTRSIITWATGEAASGEYDRQTLLELTGAAGYDLAGVLS